MGLLLDLLKGAAGEKSIHSAIGRWRQAVSKEVENALTTGSLITRRDTTVQTLTVAADDLILNAQASSIAEPGVTYNSTTGEYELAANSTFDLAFYGQFSSWDTVATDNVVVEWVTSLNIALVGGIPAYYAPLASTLDTSIKPVARVIIRTGAVPVVVKIRATQVNSTSVDLSVDSYAIVSRLPTPSAP